jgi:hypothetical protein
VIEIVEILIVGIRQKEGFAKEDGQGSEFEFL